jgi:hypothetical protein
MNRTSFGKAADKDVLYHHDVKVRLACIFGHCNATWGYILYYFLLLTFPQPRFFKMEFFNEK